MKNKATIGIGFISALLVSAAFWSALLSPPAQAARSYHFTGKVTGIHGDTIALSHGLETLEFSRASAVNAQGGQGGLSRAKIGDEITIWYQLDALKAEPFHAPAQQPGQAAPAAHPGHKEPREKKQIIIDDRAFYDARRGDRVRDASMSGV